MHVGAGWTVQVPHLLVGSQSLHFRWYCTATADDCVPFEPRWE